MDIKQFTIDFKSAFAMVPGLPFGSLEALAPFFLIKNIFQKMTFHNRLFYTYKLVFQI